eukprot:357700-Chlamydomonas_euryale.AAC.4
MSAGGTSLSLASSLYISRTTALPMYMFAEPYHAQGSSQAHASGTLIRRATVSKASCGIVQTSDGKVIMPHQPDSPQASC